MTPHKFAIGQAVDFNSRLPSTSKPRGPFDVVSVLPAEGGDSPTYRLKSKVEPFARAAKETDLVAIEFSPGEQTAAALWANPVSGRWLPVRSR
jgi:hypothetical protein